MTVSSGASPSPAKARVPRPGRPLSPLSAVGGDVVSPCTPRSFPKKAVPVVRRRVSKGEVKLKPPPALAKTPTPARQQQQQQRAADPAVSPPDDRFERVRELGRGASGVVWLVRRRADAALFAMKSVPLPSLANRCEKAMNARRQAIREVDILRSLRSSHVLRHEESIFVPASGDRSLSELHMVTQYCDAGDLASLLRRRLDADVSCSGLTEAEVWQCAARILAGLCDLHDQRILHRDLKPANIFLERNSAENGDGDGIVEVDGSVSLEGVRLLVGDLGIARTVTASQPFAETMVGTPLYIAPELFEGEPYDEKADVYSYGVCLYELMHGRPPWADAQNVAGIVHHVLQLDGEPEAHQVPFDSTFSQRLRDLVGECLTKDPTMRPSAVELWERFPQEHRDLAPPAEAAVNKCEVTLRPDTLRQELQGDGLRGELTLAPAALAYEVAAANLSLAEEGSASLPSCRASLRASANTIKEAPAEREGQPEVAAASALEEGLAQVKGLATLLRSALMHKPSAAATTKDAAVSTLGPEPPDVAPVDEADLTVKVDIDVQPTPTVPTPGFGAPHVVLGGVPSLLAIRSVAPPEGALQLQPTCSVQTTSSMGNVGPVSPEAQHKKGAMAYVAKAQAYWSKFHRKKQGADKYRPQSPPPRAKGAGARGKNVAGVARGGRPHEKPTPGISGPDELGACLEIRGLAPARMPRPSSRAGRI